MNNKSYRLSTSTNGFKVNKHSPKRKQSEHNPATDVHPHTSPALFAAALVLAASTKIETRAAFLRLGRPLRSRHITAADPAPTDTLLYSELIYGPQVVPHSEITKHSQIHGIGWHMIEHEINMYSIKSLYRDIELQYNPHSIFSKHPDCST
jgi:hypothetical protein